MKLSIVSTLYQSADHLQEFYERCSESAQKLVGDDYEIILVNDCSPDRSCELAVQLANSDIHVVVIDLSRNFGHHKAMMTGLMESCGDHVFLIDCDLEEEPELLARFTKSMVEKNCDVVYGVQNTRKGRFFECWSGGFFYQIFNLWSSEKIPVNAITARLMTRRYVNSLIDHQERELFAPGIWQTTGYDQQPEIVVKHSSSDTSYTLRKKVALLVNAITSFSSAPLVFIFYVGVSILLLSMIYISYLVAIYSLYGVPVEGWTTVVASIWLLGGIMVSFLGVIGIYLSKVYSEAKRRPYSVIRQIYRSDRD